MKPKRSGIRLVICGVLYLCQAALFGRMAWKTFHTQLNYRGVETSPGVWEQQLQPDDVWIIEAGFALIWVVFAVITFWQARRARTSVNQYL